MGRQRRGRFRTGARSAPRMFRIRGIHRRVGRLHHKDPPPRVRCSGNGVADRPVPEGPTSSGETAMSEPIGSVTVRTSPTRSRLVLSGEVDMSLAEELSAAVDNVLAVGLPVDVDVRDVTFLDSSGLSKIVRLATSSTTRTRLITCPSRCRRGTPPW
ncbi:STAS domain-containing protein [Georgenia sp. SUBG003]|uniref:STAS domain-containing protein n=1 Tax=Georgenia sp. SUBG003 TaxID=1497974 RepID=UPI003AB87FF9